LSNKQNKCQELNFYIKVICLGRRASQQARRLKTEDKREGAQKEAGTTARLQRPRLLASLPQASRPDQQQGPAMELFVDRVSAQAAPQWH
jgi:hypothetical protein